MKTTTVIAVVLAAVVCSIAAWTQGPPPPGGPGGAGRMGGPMMACPEMVVMPPPAFMMDHIAQALELTKSQSARVKTITAKNERSMRSLMQKCSDASGALRKGLLASKYDPRRVRDLAAAAERAEAAVVSAGIDQWTQIRAILTAKQASKLQSVLSMPPHPGPRGPGPGQFGPPPPPGR
jgi:Spy/CpxP family protein refolding chaperone